MENKYIKIYRNLDPDTKLEKLLEEARELVLAIEIKLRHDIIYKEDNKDQFIEVLKEYGDVSNVIKQLCICRYSISLDELKAYEAEKADRSLSIIREMEKTGESYNSIRYRGDEEDDTKT